MELKIEYMLRPFDGANTYALVQGDFKRPDWLEDLVEDAQKAATRGVKPKPPTPKALTRMMKKIGTRLGLTWP